MEVAWHAQPPHAQTTTNREDAQALHALLRDLGLTYRDFVVYYFERMLAVCANADARDGYCLYVPYSSVRNWSSKLPGFVLKRQSYTALVEAYGADPGAPVIREMVNTRPRGVVVGGVKAIDVTYPPGSTAENVSGLATVVTVDTDSSLVSVTPFVPYRFFVADDD